MGCLPRSGAATSQRNASGWIFVLAVGFACANANAPTIPGTGAVFGQVRLVPREGVTPGTPGGGAYANPAMRDVRFVDYSRPGFSVVYAHELSPPDDTLKLSIQGKRRIARIEPREAAVGAAGTLIITNETSQARVVSDPAGGRIHSIAPSASVEIRGLGAGLHSLYLLDDPSVTAHVFVAPGPYVVVSGRGRYALAGLPPGGAEIRAWHPRFPATATPVEIPVDGSVEVDLEFQIEVDERRGHDEN